MEYNKNAEKNLTQLSKGAFLTTEYVGKRNTMTIAWGAVGFMWGKPVFIAMVRATRHTHKLIEGAKEFTISIPAEDKKEALILCGTKSGKDMDKFEQAKLDIIKSQTVNTPIINCKGTHYECATLYKSDMDPKNLDLNVQNQWYADKDYHTFYYAEIVNTIEI